MQAWEELGVLLRLAADLAEVLVGEVFLVHHLAAHDDRRLAFGLHLFDVLARAVDAGREPFQPLLVLGLFKSNQVVEFLEHAIVSSDESLLRLGALVLKFRPHRLLELVEESEAFLIESVYAFEKFLQGLVPLARVRVHLQ